MKRLATITALLLACLPGHAGEVELSWTNPTGQEQCTDAGPLPDLAGTRIWQLVAEIDDPETETVTLPGLLPGTYRYVATSYTESGAESRTTGAATKQITTFQVTDNRAYTTITLKDRFALVVIGTVPLGTDCDPDQSVNGRHVVPLDQVTITGNVEPLVVVAQCG